MRRALRVLAGLAVAGLSVWTALRLEVVLDVSTFMLGDRADAGLELSRSLTSGSASRTLTLLVEHPERGRAAALARRFEDALREHPGVEPATESLQGGPPAGFEEAMWRLYERRSLAFVASSPEEVAAATSTPALSRALDDALDRLAGPSSAFVARLLPADPLLVLPRLMASVREEGGGLQVVGGRFVTETGTGAVLFLRTRASAFSGSEQADLLETISATFAALPGGEEASLSIAGLHRFSASVERSIKADITRVSTLSIVSLLLLFGALFRSFRVLCVTALVIHSGFVSGLAACLLLYGRVHGLTLAFGASLIGVAIDYALHFFGHHALSSPPVDGDRLLRRLFPGLTLGAATTVLGLVALGASGLPGLREVGVFAAVGIAAALGATAAFVPPALGAYPAPGAATRLAAALEGLRYEIQGHRALWGLPVLALALGAVGVPRLEWQDDLRKMMRIDPELVAEEERVRDLVSPFERQRLVLSRGRDMEAALRVDERVRAALAGAAREGALERFRSVSSLLPSAKTQRAVASALRADTAWVDRLESLALQRGFSPSAFAPLRGRLEAEPPPALDWDELTASPLGELVSTFRVEVGGQVGLLTFLGGVEDPALLQDRLHGIDGAQWFDQGAMLTAASGNYLRRVAWGLGLGGLGVLLLVLLRYRSVSRSLRASGPAFLAVVATLGTLGCLGWPIGLVGLTALLMVFSMGVDYGVFLTEARGDEAAAPLLGVCVAWLSTWAGFGLLALSVHPALRSIGLVAAVGITAAALLAPAGLLLSAPSVSKRAI